MKGSAWLAAITLATTVWTGTALAADQGSLQGSWKGPWYIGMSSGVATVEISADGSGRIAFTNLENFGEEPATLTKTSFDGKTFKFSATGANGTEFSVSMQMSDGDKRMRGNGKYGGFGARLELQRAE